MFVKLQRPPPEIRIFLPAVSFRSSTTTDRPRLPASMAHIRPAAPAPIITTSWVTRRSYMMFRSKQGGGRMPSMHEVNYKVFGDDMQFVEVELDPGEALFMTVFLNKSAQKKHVAFGAPYPGKIVPVHLAELGGELIAQKDSFLAAAKGVSIGIAFQKRIGVGLFGGEGFIMQRLQGDGWAFVHAGGMLTERTLAPGEIIRVDTGCIVAFQPTVDYDIQFVGKIKSALFGGEGLFFATLRGPGRIWLQSLPLSRLAGRIVAAAPQTGRGGKEEGSILGRFGNILDGDNS